MKTKFIYLVFPSIIAIIFIFGGSYIYKTYENSKPYSSGIASPTNYVEMDQDDADRIEEIVTGVVEDTDLATDDTRQEITDLFAKYKMTDEEITLYKFIGPGFFHPNYDPLFFADSLKSLQTKSLIKSDSRTNLEELVARNKSFPTAFAEKMNQEIEKMSKGEPAMQADEVLTEDKLEELLFESQIRLARLNTLFDLSLTSKRCPEDFLETDEGVAEKMVALDRWSKEFYDANPNASVGNWATARHQYYVDNNCVVALKGYDDVIAGKANPEKMNIINNVIKNAVQAK